MSAAPPCGAPPPTGTHAVLMPPARIDRKVYSGLFFFPIIFLLSRSHRLRQALWVGGAAPNPSKIPPPAGGGTLRWGTFLPDEKGTKESPEGGRTPLGYPPAQLHCALLFPASWARQCAGSLDALRAPAPLRLGTCTPMGRLNRRGTSACAPIGAQTPSLFARSRRP